MSHYIEPLCPRNNRKMKYEETGVRWGQPFDDSNCSLNSYRCGFFGCTVRYTPEHGYFTVIKGPSCIVRARTGP